MTTRKTPQEPAQPALDLETAGFEAIYARLEAVSQALEAGGLTLEQSLGLYEEGMKLAQRCQALLADVEQRIETLRQPPTNG